MSISSNLFIVWGLLGAEGDYAEQRRPVRQLLLEAHGDAHHLHTPPGEQNAEYEVIQMEASEKLETEGGLTYACNNYVFLCVLSMISLLLNPEHSARVFLLSSRVGGGFPCREPAPQLYFLAPFHFCNKPVSAE